jgi:hypothetical protein
LAFPWSRRIAEALEVVREHQADLDRFIESREHRESSLAIANLE